MKAGSDGRAGRVLGLALASRLLLLGACLLADWSFEDLDTSARLQGFPCAAGRGEAGAAAGALAGSSTKPPLGVWDTVYFSRVARCGYETDKSNAFFPGLPSLMGGGARAAAAAWSLLFQAAPPWSPEAAHAVAGLAANVAAFSIAALCLHRLGIRVLLAGNDGQASSSFLPPAAPAAEAHTPGARRRSARLAGGAGGEGPGEGSSGEQQAGQRHAQQRQGKSAQRAQQVSERASHAQQAQRVVDLAVLLFCLSPASVFYSAAYSEALFAAATWAGLLLLPDRHWAGVASLAAAAAVRSNGILGAWFPIQKALVACWGRAGREAAPEAAGEAAGEGGKGLVRNGSLLGLQGWTLLAEAGRAALSCAVIWAPYVAMQAHAYHAHCGPAAAFPRPPWCSRRLPSVYGWIQREYWDVGLLRFYRDPARLPMVLMSVPVALLSVGGCWAYFSGDWRRALSLGLLCRAEPAPRWLVRLECALQRRLASMRLSWSRSAAMRIKDGQAAARQRKAGSSLQGAANPLLLSRQAAPLVYHWALMTAAALLAMHVNVATRFLSACPPLYWHAASVALEGGWRARALWFWCLSYIALGCLLFPNFYPWT